MSLFSFRFCLCPSYSEDYDAYIVVSFTNATLVLSIGETVEEVTDSGFLGTTPTLTCAQLGEDALIQVMYWLPQGVSGRPCGGYGLACGFAMASFSLCSVPMWTTYLSPNRKRGACVVGVASDDAFCRPSLILHDWVAILRSTHPLIPDDNSVLQFSNCSFFNCVPRFIQRAFAIFVQTRGWMSGVRRENEASGSVPSMSGRWSLPWPGERLSTLRWTRYTSRVEETCLNCWKTPPLLIMEGSGSNSRKATSLERRVCLVGVACWQSYLICHCLLPHNMFRGACW